MSDRRFRPGSSLRHTGDPVDLALVAADQRELVGQQQNFIIGHLGFEGSLNRRLRLVEAIQVISGGRKIRVPEHEVGIRRDFFLRHLDHAFESAGPMRGNAPEQTVRIWSFLLARIRLQPQLEGLVCLFQIPCHLPVVGEVDEESLAIADPIP